MNAKIATLHERPILMSAPMVRATLERRKRQTRRIVTPQPPEGAGRIFVGRYSPAVVDKFGEMQPGPEIFGAYDEDGEWGVRCPYGEPGVDTLWVREAWAGHESDDDISPSRMPAAWEGSLASAPPVWYAATETDHDGRGRWRPSIHMPRWASRITLAVTLIRVERLQNITEDDARAEGAPARLHAGTTDVLLLHRHGFRSLWQAINGKRASWESNPWVWVVGFEMIGDSA